MRRVFPRRLRLPFWLVCFRYVFDWLAASEVKEVDPFSSGSGYSDARGNCNPSCGPYFLLPVDTGTKPAAGSAGTDTWVAVS